MPRSVFRPLGPALAALGAFALAALSTPACSSDPTPATDGGADATTTDDATTGPTDGGPGADSSVALDSSAGVATTYAYSSETSAASASDALAGFVARGAEGRAYIGPYLGAGLATADLYVRPTPAVGLTYELSPATREAPTAFVARLDAAGARGLAFKGPVFLDGATQLVFVKNAARGATYTYATSPGTDDEATSLAAMNDMGKNGFAYLADVVADDTQPSARVRLFQKTSVGGATYTYTFDDAPNERGAFETSLANRGRTGAVWRGALAFGLGSRFLFETASTTKGEVRYALDDDPGTDAAALVAKLGPRGAQGYYYLGPYLLGGKSTIVSMQGPPVALPLGGTVLP